ncbi:hypothetical protein [Oceanobacillus sp. CFH 90083]|uniref:hypothetical protein n=1 Tax=Oceanobacillus sp. CFH 90083 TaxID=2592336 RepID=UPI00128D0D79|nr:hypothetical protein [Oceanobacillus sp. CFH 90083]
MKKLISMMICVLLLLGACSTNEQEENVKPAEMNPDELPEVPAFENEFTREFLQSVEPVREGYYPFLSKSESFTMDFPEETIIEQRSHIVGPENRSETVELIRIEKLLDIRVNYKMHYNHFMSSEENSKEQMSARANRDLDGFKPIETNFDKQGLEIAEYKPFEDMHSILAIIWNESHQQIQINITVVCTDDKNKKNCIQLPEEEKENIIDHLKSIELIPYEEE